MEFPGVLKKEHVEIPWVLFFDLGISKGCHTILQNFHGCSFVFFEFSASKVTNLKILGVFSENSHSRKNPKREVEDMELQNVLEKEHVEFPGTIKEDVEFPGVFNKSYNVEFPWVLVFDLEISKPRVATQFCRISRRESLFFFQNF